MNIVRNSTMSDKISAALNRNPVTGLKNPNKERDERKAKLKASFRPTSHKFALAASAETPPMEVEPAKVLEMPSPPSGVQAAETEHKSIVVTQPPPEEPQFIAPDLKWLGKDTPFAVNLNPVVGKLKDAKARIVCALEFALKSEKEKEAAFQSAQATLEHERAVINDLRGKMAHIEDVIAGLSLVAEQSVEVADLLVVPTGKPSNGTSEKRYLRASATDPTVCRYSDIVEFFEQNRGINWRTQEIIGELPTMKQAHARKSIGQVLWQMNRDGKIERMSQGVYRMP